MNVFIDLDGVLVDLWEGYKKVTGIPLDIADRLYNFDQYQVWKPAMEVENFWFNLQKLEGADDLLVYMLENHPHDKTFILSAPVRCFEGCVEQKTNWAKTHTHVPHDNIHIVPRKNKKDFAYCDKFGVPNILIDDYEKNINEWVEHGGIGILHTDINITLSKLHEILEKQKYA